MTFILAWSHGAGGKASSSANGTQMCNLGAGAWCSLQRARAFGGFSARSWAPREEGNTCCSELARSDGAFSFQAQQQAGSYSKRCCVCVLLLFAVDFYLHLVCNSSLWTRTRLCIMIIKWFSRLLFPSSDVFAASLTFTSHSASFIFLLGHFRSDYCNRLLTKFLGSALPPVAWQFT